MDGIGKKSEKTVAMDVDPDFFEDLSEYLDVLSNPQRLKILKSIEREPKDLRQIASEIEISYENAKKHMRRLVGASLVLKEAGFGQPTSKGVHPVWKYSLAPHAFDIIVRHLGVFSAVSASTGDRAIQQRLDTIRSTISGVMQGAGAALVIVSGPQDGSVFPLTRNRIAIGREDPERKPAPDPAGEVVLSAAYTAVTRISHPHAVVSEEKGQWYLEDSGSTGGTVVNGTVVLPHRKTAIGAGDTIELGKGPSAARLSFVLLRQE